MDHPVFDEMLSEVSIDFITYLLWIAILNEKNCSVTMKVRERLIVLIYCFSRFILTYRFLCFLYCEDTLEKQFGFETYFYIKFGINFANINNKFLK